MPRTHAAPADTFSQFGELLRYLRQRARLTQRELSIAVGYSESHISRLEQGQRPPDSATIRARFLPPLDIDDPALAERLVALGELARGQRQPPSVEPPLGPDSQPGDPQPPAFPAGLLATKLFAPPLRHAMLPRSQLVARLDAALALPLTVIAAPAGSGKTSLIAAWYGALARGDGASRPIARAWLSLDAGDSELPAFLRYLVAALRQASPELGQALGELPDAPAGTPAARLTPLVNALARLPHPIVLVLDDYHTITDPAIHASLSFLLERGPPQLHLVVLTREDPPLPTARLRARRQLLELRAADLRFSHEETAAFLHEVMALAASPDEVQTLWRVTEGWAAGVQLAALALQDRADREQLLVALRSSNRYLMEYLASEVLDQLPAHLRSFLLQTAILDRMCAPLCDTLLQIAGSDGDTYSQLLLEELARRNLFLVPLDAERRWFRYHHLFAELLRARLRSGADREQLGALYQRASSWFAQHGLVEEAIMYAAGAGDWEQVSALVTRANRAFFDLASFQAWTSTTWLAAIPEAIRRQQPQLCLVQSWALRESDPVASEHWLNRAELAVEGWDDGEAQRRMRAEIAAVRSGGALFRGDSAGVISVAQAALPAIAATDDRLRLLLIWNKGRALFQEGRLHEADHALGEVIALAGAAGEAAIRSYGIAFYGYFQRACGQLDGAARTFRGGMETAGTQAALQGAERASLLIGLADLQREWNELGAALTTVDAALTLTELAGLGRDNRFGALVRARILAAMGDAQGASAALRGLRRGDDHEFLRVLTLATRAFEAQLALQSGDVAAAEAWAEVSGTAWHPLYANTPTLAVYADEHLRIAPLQIRLARARRNSDQHELTTVAAAIEAALAAPPVPDRPWLGAKLQTLRAIALDGLGERAAALDVLGAALAVAEPSRYVRLFLDEGAPLVTLLRAYREQRGAAPSVDAILAAAGASGSS